MIFRRTSSNVPVMGSPIVGAVSVFFCLVIVLHLVSTSVAAYPLDSIESCLLNDMSSFFFFKFLVLVV